MQQRAFHFSPTAIYRKEDFLRSDANAQAWEWVMRWPDWPSAALLLSGKEGTGKTHLAHLWATQAQAVWIDPIRIGEHSSETLMRTASAAVLDGLEHVQNEEGLFHLFNHVRSSNGHLLLVSRQPAARMSWQLADVRSRLAACPHTALQLPNDSLLQAVLYKLFADRQLRVDEAAIGYLVSRMERSLHAAQMLVARIDRVALEQKRNITIPFLSSLLENNDK